MFYRGPPAYPGQRIGLLGGSFDPPHSGHVHISKQALRALGLHTVWWLISPGNPLKPNGPASLERRLGACRALIRDPRIRITDLEFHLGSPYTAHTLAFLRRRYRGVRFIWLMGADNLVSFHHWERWDWIMDNFPIAVLARPGEQLRAGLSPAAIRFAAYRCDARTARGFGLGQQRGWTLLTGPMSPLSSSLIRTNGQWV